MRSHQENLYAHDISLLKFKDFYIVSLSQFSATCTIWHIYFQCWSGWQPWTVGWKRSECNLCHAAWSAAFWFMHISMHSSCIYLEKKPFPNRSIKFRYLLPIEECSGWTSCAVNSWQSRKRIPGKPTRTGDHFTDFTIENFNFYNAPLALWQNSWSAWVFDPASTGLPVPSDGLRPQLRCWHEKRGTKVEYGGITMQIAVRVAGISCWDALEQRWTKAIQASTYHRAVNSRVPLAPGAFPTCQNWSKAFS
jgi:hypothetical protein